MYSQVPNIGGLVLMIYWLYYKKPASGLSFWLHKFRFNTVLNHT